MYPMKGGQFCIAQLLDEAKKYGYEKDYDHMNRLFFTVRYVNTESSPIFNTYYWCQQIPAHKLIPFSQELKEAR